MTRVIVLGWDALDIELAERFGVAEQFGVHRQRIETHINPAIDEPHTLELWPSMITGVLPDEHGIVAATEGDGAEWDSPLLSLASSLANGVVPDAILTPIGAALREREIGIDITTPAYYDDQGLRTVFDDVGGRAISIPNYYTDRDERLDIDPHRSDVWAALVAEWDDGTKVPQVSAAEIAQVLGREVGARAALTRQAYRAGEPLVWTWFGALDTVGHIDPALDVDLTREWYELAAGVTRHLRETVADDTTVLVVSDHGLQDGSHTHYATVASDDADAVAAIDHVTDVADWVRATVGDSPGPASEVTVASEDAAAVHEHLEDLGYI